MSGRMPVMIHRLKWHAFMSRPANPAEESSVFGLIPQELHAPMADLRTREGHEEPTFICRVTASTSLRAGIRAATGWCPEDFPH